ncbi:MAG: hypothetical protein Q7V62_02205 [Actinomycetota bacterium]|nr:hypothetical protein [Actinomycetota bacterium]
MKPLAHGVNAPPSIWQSELFAGLASVTLNVRLAAAALMKLPVAGAMIATVGVVVSTTTLVAAEAFPLFPVVSVAIAVIEWAPSVRRLLATAQLPEPSAVVVPTSVAPS